MVPYTQEIMFIDSPSWSSDGMLAAGHYAAEAVSEQLEHLEVEFAAVTTLAASCKASLRDALHALQFAQAEADTQAWAGAAQTALTAIRPGTDVESCATEVKRLRLLASMMLLGPQHHERLQNLADVAVTAGHRDAADYAPRVAAAGTLVASVAELAQQVAAKLGEAERVFAVRWPGLN